MYRAGDRAPAHQAAALLDERLRGAAGGPILAELWRVPFRRTYHTSLGQLERDLQTYLRFCNRERPYLGYRLRGHTPAMLFFRRQVA